MAIDRAHRLDGENQRPAEDVDIERPDVELPGKRTELERAEQDETDIAALLGRSGWMKRGAESSPGRRTRVAGPDAARLDFDDHRVLALRELLARLGPGHSLRRDVIASADRTILRRADRDVRASAGSSGSSGSGRIAGRAMWQASERHAVTLYRHAAEVGEVAANDPAILAALAQRGSGQELPAELRQQLEAELDASLARVRVHTDTVAAQAAKAAKAEAFTVGEDIFFASGAFAPDQPSGRKLLVHELAHVVQALRGRAEAAAKDGARVSRPDGDLEREADEVVERVERLRAQTAVDAAQAARASTEQAQAPAAPPRALDPLGARAVEARLGRRVTQLLGEQPALRRAELPASLDEGRAASAWGEPARMELLEEELAAGRPGARQASRFDDFRAIGLRQMLRVANAHGGQRLLQATLGASDPEVAQAAIPSARVQPPRGEAGGRAMWRAAERYAATLYRRAMDSGEVDADSPAVEAALRRCGSGQPLSEAVRRLMEDRLGVPLERVRIHVDRVAAEAARAVHADAFTVGEDIFFADGAYAPESREGQRLLAHELTHVVQGWQGRTRGDGRVSKPGDSLEREADAVADRVARDDAPVRPAPASGNAAKLQDDRGEREALWRPAQLLPVRPARTPRPPRPARSAVTPRPLPLPMPGAQTLLRRANGGGGGGGAGGPSAPTGTGGPQRASMPSIRGGARRAGRAARQDMQGASGDFATRARQAGDHATSTLKHGLDGAKAVPPGKRAQELAKSDRKAAQAGEHEARSVEQRQRAKANARASQPVETGGAEHDAGPRGDAGDARSPIQLKPIDDWSKYMPEALPDQDDRERARIQKLVKTKIEGERSQARQGLEKLRTAHLQQARDVRAMKPKLQTQIAKSQQQALGQVASSESSQCGAVQAHVASVQGQVRAHAAAMKGQVTAAHAAAIARINATHTSANQKLTQAKTKALADANNAESLAVLALQADFLGLKGRFTALGGRKAGDAITVGEEESGKMSGRWDGEKLEAAQKAARDTADGFATSMAEQASAKYGEIEANKPAAEQALRDLAKTTRDNITKAYDSAKQSLDAAKQSSTQAADAAKTAALGQIDQAASSSVAQLGATGATQVAAIRKQAQGARTGITAAGNAARAGVAQTCDQSASGIEKGIAGLIRGAKQIEAPNPEATQAQVAQGAQGLERGAAEIGKGLSDTASKSSTGLAQQASGAAEGMASAAAAAKQAATQIGAGAKQQMSAIATGTSNSLSQVAEAHKTTSDNTVTSATTGFADQITALGQGFEQAATQRATEFENNYKACESGLNQAVPDRGGGGGGAGSGKKEGGEGGGEGGGAAKGEVESIQENAQKAADAVKPWWQKALAVVVSIIVAVVVVIVVTALIVTTGPVGAILVGAAAGALASVAGTMASNLVLGNGLFDGITWKTVLVGAIGGGLGAGLTAGLGAGASALANSARFAGTALGRGASATSTALTGTASTLSQFAIKTGVGVATDFVSDQTANLIVNQKLDISVENLVLSVVTNAATSHAKFDAFQAHVQQGIQSRTPINVNLPRLQLQIGGPPPGAGAHGAGGAGTGGAGGPGPAGAGGPAPTGAGPGAGGPGPVPRPSADGGAGPVPRPGGDGPAPTPPGSGSGGPAPTPRADGGANPTPHADGGNGGPGPAPSGPGANPTPRTDGGNGGNGANPTPRADGGDGANPNPMPRTDSGDGANPNPNPTPRTDGGDGANPNPTPRADGGDGPNTAPRTDGDGPNTAPRTDGDAPDGANPMPRTDGGDGPNQTPRADGGDGPMPRADGDGPNQTPRADGANGPDGPRRPGADGPDGANPTPRADGGDGPTRADGGDSPDVPTRTDGPGTDDGSPADAAAAARDSELGDLGYPEGTRAKAEELAARVEQGDVPPKESVRDTEANQRGLDELRQLAQDPSLTPEQKAQLQREIAAKLRESPDPTGNLPRDIADARTRSQDANGRDPNGPTQDGDATDTGASGGIDDASSTYRGDVVTRDNSHNVRTGVEEALPNVGNHFAPGKVTPKPPDKLEIDINGTPTEVRIEVVPKDQLANPTDVANFDLSTTPPTIRVSGNTKKQHVERALAHEVAEMTSILEARGGSGSTRGTDNALGWDSTSQRLSHDDIGRLAELRVLMADLNNPSRPKSETQAEIKALLKQLGMMNTDGTAFNTGGLGGQRRTLVEAEGIDLNAVGAALGLTPSAAPKTGNDGLPLRGEHADPDAVPRRDVTFDEVDAIMPPELVEALGKFGLSREAVVRYIVEHHNNRSRQRYLPDLEGLARQYAPNGLTHQDVMLIDLYTTKLYYKELNSRLRDSRDVDSVEHLQALLNDALTKLPPVSGAELYRSISLKGAALAKFLADVRSGTLRWPSFNSVASDIDGTFPSDNVLFVIRNGTAYDISDFGDGIHYKDPANPGRELLMEGGVEFRVTGVHEEVQPDGSIKYRIELEQVPPPPP